MSTKDPKKKRKLPSRKKKNTQRELKSSQSLPSLKDLKNYIENLDAPPSFREILRFFHIRARDKNAFKHLLLEYEELSDFSKTIDGEKKHFLRKLKEEKRDELPQIVKVIVTKKEHNLIIAKPVDNKLSFYELHINPSNRVNLQVFEKALVLCQGLIKKNIYKAKVLKKFNENLCFPKTIMGIVKKVGKKMNLSPVDRRLARSYQISKNTIKAAPGDLVEASVLRDYGRSGGIVSIVKKRGNISDPKFISLIEVYQSEIPYKFSPKATHLAEEAKLPPLGNREDLRGLSFVTIDGEDAKDFDDAVWAKKTKQGWHIIVAIADVAYYVRPDNVLDREAYERGNSVYFPDLVVPMLPEYLSNGMCSLKPNEDRGSLAVHMWIDEQGNLLNYRFTRALIKSHARLTYNKVQQVYNAPEADPEIWKLIEPLFCAYNCLKHDRLRRGTLELELEERQIIFNKQGNVREIRSRQRFDSHKLIEEMMILANVAAARALEDKKMPSLFRIHEKPNPEKMTILLNALKAIGIQVKATYKQNSGFFNTILEETKDHPTKFLVQSMVLRTQSQAAYHPGNSGHFGLSLKHYAHFTSPIRRYADLVVHRSLITALNLGEGGWETTPTLDALETVGNHISNTERTAKSAERNTLSRYTISYMENKIGTQFQAHISGVNMAGLFIELDENGAEGFMPKSYLPPDVYRLLNTSPCLQGDKHSFTLGDPLYVCLKEANAHTNGMIFSFIGK